MKTITRIAKTELRLLFYSPIAWFLMIVFLVQCGLAYTSLLGGTARTQEIGGLGLEYMTMLTQRIFAGRGGLFSNVMEKLYLYIPLLTMSLISRETGSGTIKLLYSSPVKVREIVFGKYLAMMVYSLLLVCIIGIFMVAGNFQIKAVDNGMLLSAVLGFYLLLCAYSAIGLFMSTLSTYQVVAAVSTFVMIGILSYIGTLWQGIDFVRDITYFLSLYGRTEHMLGGLITTKDVLYFILIVYIFLGLSIYKLKAGMESKPAAVKIARYLAIVVSALLAGYVSSRPALVGYYDATADKIRTLTPNSRRIIKELGKEPLEVITYNNLLGKFYYYGLPQQRNYDLARWEPYLRFKPDIDFKYVNYYDSAFDGSATMGSFYPGKTIKEIASQIAKASDLDIADFKTPEQIHKMIDLKPELNRYVMQLKYKGRTTFLRVFDDQQVFPGETEVAAAFKRLLQAKLPKIAFLTGNYERSINEMGERDYQALTNLKTFRYSLINQGFDVDTVSLDTQELPADVSTLVIADPRSALSATAQARIQQYINRGGNLLIAGEPGKQDVLNPLLQQFGVQLMPGMIVRPDKTLAPDLALIYITGTAAGFSTLVNKSFKDSVPVSMSTATGIAYTPGAFTIKPLLTTDTSTSWLTQSKLVKDSAAIAFSAANGDERKVMATAVALTRQVNGKEQRIVVAGDADFMSTAELKRYGVKVSNFVFNTSLFSWLSYGAFPIDTARPDAKDNRVKITSDGVGIYKIIFLWVLPALLLAAGAILLVRRKRK